MNLRASKPALRAVPARPGLDRRLSQGGYACLLTFVWAVVGGCSGNNAARFDDQIQPVTQDDKAIRTAIADWDDVDAAVDAALVEAEVAVIRPRLMGPRFTAVSFACRVYLLRSITDAEGLLVVAYDWQSEPSAKGSVPITVRAEVEGQPAATEILVLGVARRLAQLAGVETAPRE